MVEPVDVAVVVVAADTMVAVRNGFPFVVDVDSVGFAAAELIGVAD